MYMLGEVNLPTFLNSSQGKFMKQQMTDEQYSYILSHALVTFWIESVPREIFKKFISVLQNKMIRQPFQNKSILFIPEASSNSKKILKPPTNNINLSIK